MPPGGGEILLCAQVEGDYSDSPLRFIQQTLTKSLLLIFSSWLISETSPWSHMRLSTTLQGKDAAALLCPFMPQGVAASAYSAVPSLDMVSKGSSLSFHLSSVSPLALRCQDGLCLALCGTWDPHFIQLGWACWGSSAGSSAQQLKGHASAREVPPKLHSNEKRHPTWGAPGLREEVLEKGGHHYRSWETHVKNWEHRDLERADLAIEKGRTCSR